MSTSPMRSSTLSPFESATTRQSPFRRQNSVSPATAVRAATPTASPARTSSQLSPTKAGSLSPEKTSPFVRRPSQINHSTERPASPFARPAGNLSIPSSPSRKTSDGSRDARTPEVPSLSPVRRPSTPPATEDTPSLAAASPYALDGSAQAHRFSEETLAESPSFKAPSQANLRPTMHRTTTSSTTSTIKPPVFTTQPKMATPKLNAVGGGAYSHIPQALLHSMRESFEVLDSNNTGAVSSASVADMLSQLGLDSNPSALKDFFPPNGPSQLNLARYLDIVSGPLADLSQSDELRAAFEAFDVDDSGQIDIALLRDALLHTAPPPGGDMARLSEKEVDNVLLEFAGRRAFGAKGLSVSKSKGDVFRYRDFMANVSGGGVSMPGVEPVAVVQQ